MPIPKSRHYLSVDGEWVHETLLALSKVHPEQEAVQISDGRKWSKNLVVRIHSLARRYGFKVCCRPIHDGTVLVWVRKPGMDKNILKLWGP